VVQVRPADARLLSLNFLRSNLYRADYNKGSCTDPLRRSVELEAESVETVGSINEPEVAQAVRRSHSRAFKA
jgi:hypothetical protein